MTSLRTLGAVAATAVMAVSGAANATTTFNQALASPGFYAGSGNPNEGFTVDTANNIELGLGLHYRYGANISPSPTSGNVYNVQTGYYGSGGCAGICSLWNIDFSINLRADGTGGSILADYVPTLEVKNQNTGGIVSFNMLDAFPDNYGWNGSKNTAYDPSGYVGPAIDNTSVDYGLQNSENLAFSPFGTGTLNFDPTANTSYLVTLFLAPSTSSPATGGSTPALSVQQVQIQINATPIPAALPLFASGLGVMGFLVRRKKRKGAAPKAAA